jgi:NAD(P)-dependent dehydrogenase (short-subunit alcohol dehydrogenase family)
MPSLKDRIALVTGSTSGIGKGIASHFLSLDASVIVHGPDLASASATAEAMRSGSHAVVDAVAGDLRNVDACRQIIRTVVELHGGLDVLVNNAATVARCSLEDATVDQWETIMAVNVRAPFLLIQEAVRAMKARGGGSIVNIGSINAYVGLPQLGPYSVSKGALMTMTKNAAMALGRYRIRVNQLNVGWTLTEGEEAVQRADGKGPDWYQEACATRPFGRLLLPADIAHAAAYFASDDSAVISGAVVDLEEFPLGGLQPW